MIIAFRTGTDKELFHPCVSDDPCSDIVDHFFWDMVWFLVFGAGRWASARHEEMIKRGVEFEGCICMTGECLFPAFKIYVIITY